MSLTRYTTTREVTIPVSAQRALESISHHARDGRTVTAIYNEGTMLVPTNVDSRGNILIYNAPKGTVVLHERITCSWCGEEFQSHAEKTRHKRLYPTECTEHNVCFYSWEAHNREYTHTRCGFWDCSRKGVDYGSDWRYQLHFKDKHGFR